MFKTRTGQLKEEEPARKKIVTIKDISKEERNEPEPELSKIERKFG